jgi:ElaB/YqjD/DUF883 family membrane-anchored ribosome-binding protein
MKTTEQASNYVHDAVDKITKATNHATDALEEKGDQIKNAEEHMVANCRSYIRDNPITAVGAAVAAGFLLSRLLSSR